MKKISIILALTAAGAFLWWAFSPLLFDVEIQDELPITPATPESATTLVSDQSEASNETSPPTEAAKTVSKGPYEIKDTSGHPASGSVRIIHTPEESIVRFENYTGTNGPDLKIYLATDLEATEFVSLGDAKGNKGNINYPVPSDIDLADYQYVLTWCEAFGVLFDYVELD